MNFEKRHRPIRMRGPQVVATIAGRSTRAHRLVRPWPDFLGGKGQESEPGCWGWGDDVGAWVTLDLSRPPYCGTSFAIHGEEYRATSPFGETGDLLWVRESWAPRDAAAEKSRDVHSLFYRADDATPPHVRWRPSTGMPRWACRLVLEVADVRVERIQSISEVDAIAEGVSREDWIDNCWAWVIDYKMAAHRPSVRHS